MTLDKLSKNQTATITGIKQDSIAPKLEEMGLYPGKSVTLLYRAPLGDPIALDLEGYTLTLRKEEASFVEVD